MNKSQGFWSRIKSKFLSMVGLQDLNFFGNLRNIINQDDLIRPYGQHVWIYSSVNAIANAIASVPFAIFTGDKTKEKEKVDDIEHPLVSLFENPNPFMSKFQLWESWVIHMLIRGESIFLWERPKGKERTEEAIPEKVYNLNAENFEPVLNDSNTNIIGWIMKDYKGYKTPLTTTEISQFKLYNPYQPERGLSPLAAAAISIKQDWSARQYNRGFFDNSADPGGILKVKRTGLTKDKIIELRKEWEDLHRGASKARRVAVLQGDIDYQQIQISQRDMQLIEMLKMTRDELLAIYKVPKGEVGIYEDMNFATAKQQDKVFWTKTVIPKLKMIEDQLWNDLFSKVENGKYWGEFDLTNVEALQEDIGLKIDNAVKLAQIGVPLNSVIDRLDLGIKRVDWGDDYFVNAGMITATDIVGGLQPSPQAQTEPEKPQQIIMTPESEEEETVEIEEEESPEKRFTNILDKQKLRSRREQIRFWNTYIKRVFQKNERDMFRKVKKYFSKYRIEQLKQLHEVLGKSILSKQLSEEDIRRILVSDKKFKDLIAKESRPVFENIISSSAEGLNIELGNTFQVDLTDPTMLEFLDRKIEKMKMIHDTMNAKITKQIRLGSEAGEAVTQLADRLRTVFKLADSQAFTVARTETAMASSTTRFQILEQEGTAKHQWITAGDEAVRASHRKVNGTVIKIGDHFTLVSNLKRGTTTSKLLHPSDPAAPPHETINCRCVAVPVR